MNHASQNISEEDVAIELEDVSKTFPVEVGASTVYRVVKAGLQNRFRNPGRFSALSEISFRVMKGDKVGIIGDNGSGKTTLLKVAAGLYKTNGGRVVVNGDVTLLAGLGIGMLEELTLEENLFLYGAIYGLGRRTVASKLAEIIEWAELQEFVGSKLKTLSSGMKTRLAFSACRHIDKEIYLMDEVLTAGDKHFKQKCEEVFVGYKQSRKTFLVTTHEMGFVTNFCNKALWLHKGQQMAYGESEAVVKLYRDSKTR